MNIFDKFLKEIKLLVLENKKKLKISNHNEFKGVIVENPPVEFNHDLSCNISLILAKLNSQNPKILAENIKTLLLEGINEIDKIEVAGPGFLNIKLKNSSLKTIVINILKKKSNYGAKNNNGHYE